MRKFVKNVEGEFASKAKELVVSDEASLQLELNDIQSSDDLRHSLQVAGSEMFWTHSRGLAILVLTMFGSAYTCESSFSRKNV